jgi:hypothetical protein
MDRHYEDFIFATELLGLTPVSGTVRPTFKNSALSAEYAWGEVNLTYNRNGRQRVYSSTNIGSIVVKIEEVLAQNYYGGKSPIMAESSRDLTKNMVRVKSSNLWSIKMNVKNHGDKTGDMFVTFKDKNGGPGHTYQYFNVPILYYRRMQSAPSKGHHFWKYIRNNYNYRKLTGDKRTKLPHGIN